MSDRAIELHCGDWRVVVHPATGGRIARFEHRDSVPIFHPASEGQDGGCFPLVPFGNRVRDGRFRYAGRDYRLDANLPGERVVHGFGWQAEWRVTARTAATVRLIHDHDGGSGWPWPYTAEQLLAVEPDGLRVDLRLTNRASTPMPAGLGLHPFFPIKSGHRLHLDAQHVAAVGSDGFSTALVEATRLRAALGKGHEIGSSLYLSDVAGPIVLVGNDGRGVAILPSINLAHVVVYRPPTGEFICIEPMTHRVGALDDAENNGIAVLASGTTLTGSVQIAPLGSY